MTTGPRRIDARLPWAVFFVAAGLLGFEIALLRVLLVASWHHFAFLVISIALLGFGASGTALVLLRRRLMARSESVLFMLVLAAAVSMPVCTALARLIPIEARFTPALLGRQIAYWMLYWVTMGIPFLIGASTIGLALMIARRNVPRVYGANLLGGAAGAALVTAAMNLVPPAWLCVVTAVTTAIGAVSLRPPSRRLLTGGWIAAVGIAAACLTLIPPRVRQDPYKYGAYVQRLEQQGVARRVALTYGPRAVVEAYRGEVFHNLPFLSGGPAPPSVSVLLTDGHLAGSVLDVSHIDDATVVDHTVMAFPHVLASAHDERPTSAGPAPQLCVLLLGEAGGANVWLAKRHQADIVYAVHPDAHVFAMLRGPLREYGGRVLDLPGVRTVVAEPRHFVEHTQERFDLIQLVTLESSAAGSGGIGGLGQDHLLTVEGISACLRCLDHDGMLAATRGIQHPPRDNVKLLATFADAMRASGVSAPARHVVIVRDFLAVCTIVKTSPWTPRQIVQLRTECAKRELTPVWFPGITPEELNQPDQLPGPPGQPGDWYHYAATHLLSDEATDFIDEWAFDIRPPTDNRPFFLDFCKLSSIGELERAYGDLWLTRTELAFLFVLAAAVVVAVAGAVLTLLPLLTRGDARHVPGRCATVAYFAAIGLAYMLLEMTFLSHVTHWIGDPVTATAVTISGFLLLSGLGSLTAQRLGDAATVWVPRSVLCLIAVGLLEQIFMGRLATIVGSLPFAFRCVAALLAIAAVAYLMGFPMPCALARLDRGTQALVPWAWGVNGFASVMAAPIATAIGMTWGFHLAGGLAMLLYLVPLLLFTHLGGIERGGGPLGIANYKT